MQLRADQPRRKQRGPVGQCWAGLRWSTLALLGGLTMAGLTAGCAYQDYEPLDAPETDGFLLQPVSMTHDVHFLPGETSLSIDEKGRLQAFVDDIDPKDEATIWVDAAGRQGEERRSAVLHMLEHLGRTDVGVGAGQARSNVVTVTANRQVILPKSCLDSTRWPDPRLLPASCASTLNLIATVENQNDLIEGREMGLASGSTAAAALRELLSPGPGGGKGDGGRAVSTASAPPALN